jgi:flagellar hook assembly protein FlgD
VLEQAVQHPPGTYQFSYGTFDKEGTWRWDVVATDDLDRQSTADRTFRYDTTLQGLVAPKVARGSAAIRFKLARAAVVKAQIETTGGVVVATLASGSLPSGDRTVTWDGSLPQGTRAYAGTYVAHVFATTSTGTSDLSTQFSFRRG